MNYKRILNKAYKRLLEIYGGERVTPDIGILNRFYKEKMLLNECELYTRCLGLLGEIRTAADDRGEHIFVRGTTGSSFVAYLLGATDTNPLPRHVYCPDCHYLKFIGEGSPFHQDSSKCSCESKLITDGHNIPFESNMKSVLSGHIQLCVSHAFFEEAERMIRDKMWDYSIITLRNEKLSPTWFCLLEKEKSEGGNYKLDGNNELFARFPRITLVPDNTLDKYRELEIATGYKMKDIGPKEYSDMFFQFMEGNFDGVPHFDNSYMRDIYNIVKPQSYEDLLKLIGFGHSTNVWKNNAEYIFREHKMTLRDIPAFREDIFYLVSELLHKKGINDTGLAYEVMEKTRRGYYAKSGGLDEDTLLALLNLGMDDGYVYFIEKINYMFPKAHGVAYLHDAIRMMLYKTKFSEEYNKIMSKE